MSTDTTWYLDVNDFARHTTWLHGLLAAYALWGGLVALAALVATGWWTARRRTDAPSAVALAALTGLGALAAMLLNQQLLGPAIARTRPCHTLPHVEVLLSCANDSSMPSNHSIIAGAIVAGLWMLKRPLGAAATVLAVLLAFGRVYAGVHYPSDTIVGLLAGAAIGAVVVLTLRQPATTLLTQLSRTRVRPLISHQSGTTEQQTGRAGA